MKAEKLPEKLPLPRGVRRRGSSLQVYLTLPDGGFELRSLGRVTVKFAVQQRELWLRELAERKYVKPKPRTDQVQFSDICDRAFEYYKNYTRCWDRTESHIALFEQWWGGRAAESITTQEIDAQLLANVAPRGLNWAKSTSNEYRTTLLRVFNLAVDDGKLGLNPVAKAKRYKLDNSRIRELSLREEDALRAVIRESHSTKEPEFDLLLHLGCRRSNLYGQRNAKRTLMEPLQWKDVNLDFRVVVFRRSKSGKPYRVPINATALAAFQKLLERSDGTGAVIRKPSGRELFSCRKWFELCLEKAGIEDFRLHDLRHTFGSRLRAQNVQVEDIRYLLGHGAKSITERYAHASLDVLRAAVAKLDRATQTDTKTDTGTVLHFHTA